MDVKEEDEPERHLPLRTPPPPKKSLDQFLAEFEARLRDHPAQPATSAGQALEERAVGSRRYPVESRPDRPPRLPRRLVRPSAGPPQDRGADEAAAGAAPESALPDSTAAAAEAAPAAAEATPAPAPVGGEPAGDAGPAGSAVGAATDEDAAATPDGDDLPPEVDAASATEGAARRARNRRHKRHRHH